MWKRGREILEKWNRKPKGEQLFLLLILFAAVFGACSITGCAGGKSCEMPSFGSEDLSDGKAIGCSIPGCGGCLTSGKGCNTVCWAQSCKAVRVVTDEEHTEDGGVSLTGVDIRYYGNDCLDCGAAKKNCYFGCLKVDDEADGINGFFYLSCRPIR